MIDSPASGRRNRTGRVVSLQTGIRGDGNHANGSAEGRMVNAPFTKRLLV